MTGAERDEMGKPKLPSIDEPERAFILRRRVIVEYEVIEPMLWGPEPDTPVVSGTFFNKEDALLWVEYRRKLEEFRSYRIIDETGEK